MKVAEKHVVSIEYTLKNEAGEILDTTTDREPLTFIQGMGQLIAGLEVALEGKAIGDAFQVTLDPEQAYGPRRDDLTHQVPKTELAGIEDLSVGTMLQANTPNGVQVFTVSAIEGDTVTVDGNHPLAGQTLMFDVKVADIREATDEDLNPKGGGCCGGGGHHHHDHDDDHECCGQHDHGGGCKNH